MEPAAPPAANQATTASADFFVVPPVRQTYATGYAIGARAPPVPKMKRRREWRRKWRKSALAYMLPRPEPPPPRRRDRVEAQARAPLAPCGVGRPRARARRAGDPEYPSIARAEHRARRGE